MATPTADPIPAFAPVESPETLLPVSPNGTIVSGYGIVAGTKELDTKLTGMTDGSGMEGDGLAGADRVDMGMVETTDNSGQEDDGSIPVGLGVAVPIAAETLLARSMTNCGSSFIQMVVVAVKHLNMDLVGLPVQRNVTQAGCDGSSQHPVRTSTDEQPPRRTSSWSRQMV